MEIKGWEGGGGRGEEERTVSVASREKALEPRRVSLPPWSPLPCFTAY